MGLEDQYGNPTPALDYRPGATRRKIRADMQLHTSAEHAETGRQPKNTHWRLFTYSAIGPRERVQ